MKTQKFKKQTLLFLIPALFIFSSVVAQEVTRDYNENFSANDNTILVIENKYGKVDVRNGDQNSISIDVIVSVKHPDRDQAEKLISYIDIIFSESGNEVKAVTEFDEKFSRSGRGFNWGGESKKFSVDYTVNMPKNTNLKLYQKYGDVFIDEITGRAEIEVRYGILNANKILWEDVKPFSKITLGYSKAYIEECKWLKAEIKYSELEIEKSTALAIISSYSVLSVDESSSIVFESQYGAFNLGHLSNLVGEGKYTKYQVNQVDKKLDITTKYGSFRVDYIPSDFETIKIYSEYTGFLLDIDPEASYFLEAEAKYGKIRHPESRKLSRISQSSELKLDGLIGNNENTKSKVIIKTKYGGVRLMDR